MAAAVVSALRRRLDPINDPTSLESGWPSGPETSQFEMFHEAEETGEVQMKWRPTQAFLLPGLLNQKASIVLKPRKLGSSHTAYLSPFLGTSQEK